MMFAKLYALTLPLFFAIDMIWLGFVARGFYSKQLGHLMTPQINWAAALIFYLLFIAGLVFFVISPALKAESWQYAVGVGMLFGLMTYATYDLTNLATLKDWPILVTVVDLIWGMTLSATVSLAAFAAARWLKL